MVDILPNPNHPHTKLYLYSPPTDTGQFPYPVPVKAELETKPLIKSEELPPVKGEFTKQMVKTEGTRSEVKLEDVYKVESLPLEGTWTE